MAPRFHSLEVCDVRRETDDAVSVAFVVPEDLRDAYSFAPGQYLTLRHEIDGEDVRRSYSICVSPSDNELRVAIKHIDGGWFSGFANGDLNVGDTLDVMTPDGRFGVGSSETGRILAAVVAGSGITPVLSIAKHLLESEPDSVFHLFYGNRTSDSILFRGDISELMDRYLGRFSVHHILSREEQDIGFLNGRMDEERLQLIFDRLLPTASLDGLLICGPADLIKTTRDVAVACGLDENKIHTEYFTPAESVLPRRDFTKRAGEANEKPIAEASIILDGRRRDVPIYEGQSVLEAGLDAGLDLPFACQGGMCCTCRCRIVEGAAEMLVNYSLEPWEIEQNFTLGCQAMVKSEKITVDFDAL